MKLRLLPQDFDKPTLVAIGWLYQLGRPAKRDEARDFAQGAIDDAKQQVVEDYTHREDAR